MKSLFTIVAVVFLTVNGFAQSPQKMSYQAVVRDGSNNLIANSPVGMRISILQGSPTGSAVFVETQTPGSNANGLVSMEIGAGTLVSGDFTGIDWANGPYFIKTETDPAGGQNYSITGTSQILSVPYALHAQTAESVLGANEADPVFNSSVASGIDESDTARWNNKQEILIAGSGISISDNVINSRAYSIGDFAHGGIVFWVDETGQHGLVCAKQDQGGPVRWHAGSNGITRARGDGPFSGAANTAIIIAAHLAIGDDGSPYAALICNDLKITEGGKTYGDWYLPSIEELNLMYQNRFEINATATANGGSAFGDADYWSSTEDNGSEAWLKPFTSDGQFTDFKSGQQRVRAIRAF